MRPYCAIVRAPATGSRRVLTSRRCSAAPLSSGVEQRRNRARARRTPDSALRTFDSAGVSIAYCDEGHGPPLVLVHGLAHSHEKDWRATGWLEVLRAAGRRVIALDLRGHGRSARPRDPAAYGTALGDDVARLLDHLGLERADLCGYSLGGWIALLLLARHPERVNACVLGGCGLRALLAMKEPDAAVKLLRQQLSPAAVLGSSLVPREWTGRRFRLHLAALAKDFDALAALLQSDFLAVCAGVELPHNRRPVLLVAGEQDPLAPDPEALAQRIAGARVVRVAGTDHFTALRDPGYQRIVVEFLAQHSLVG
jgi:pimeloyl-ACP methyl ester carboxylesterase